MPDFDVIVLGGGSAGTSAAREAADAGARTALINDGELGGLCILRGCMPSKAMLASAHAVHEATHLEPFGARLEGRVVPDFRQIMARKDRQVARFQRAKIAGVEEQDYEVIYGRARFAEGGGVTVDGRKLSASRYVIATGSIPTRPPIPGIENVPTINSDDVMEMDSPPAALVVQGAGPIGLELSQFFTRIGTEVLLVNRSPLLARHDPEAGTELTRALEQEPRLELAVPGRIEELRAEGGGLVARVRSGDRIREHRADALLVATGRRAALDDLGIEHVGLRPVDGRLEHDPAMRTSNLDVFVAGDATGSDQVLHRANLEGTVAGHNAAGALPQKRIDERLKMSVIFTDPPYARIGMSQREARDAGLEVAAGVARFPETGRAITMNVSHGLWTVFMERGTCRIVGSSILGPRADDLIHLIAVMMQCGMGADEIHSLPWYHPTLSEVMLNVARDLAGKVDECPWPVMPPA